MMRVAAALLGERVVLEVALALSRVNQAELALALEAQATGDDPLASPLARQD